MLPLFTPSMPPVAAQVVAFTTATKSAQLKSNTCAITVNCSVAAYVAVGDTNIVATAANSAYVGANQPATFMVPSGSFVSILQVAAGGNAYITEWSA